MRGINLGTENGMFGKIPWNKGMGKVERQCWTCGLPFKVSPSTLNYRPCNYCSKQCVPPWNKDKKGVQVAWNKGKYNLNTYDGLHYWLKAHRGKAVKCEFCDSTYRIGWANKSHEYKPDLNDWLQLCDKCHRKYDANHKGASRRLYV